MILLTRPVFVETLASALGVSGNEIQTTLVGLGYLVFKPYYLHDELVNAVCKQRGVEFQFAKSSEEEIRKVEQALAEQEDSNRKFIAKGEETRRRKKNE